MVIINQEKCIGCGLCADDCVAINITMKDNKASIHGNCFLCGHCVAICPMNAVTISEYDMDDVESIEKTQSILDPSQVLRSIKSRRSIRKYKQKRISKDELVQLAEAGRYTATANNAQSSGFVFVQEQLEQLKSMVWNDIDRWERTKEDPFDGDALAYFSFNQRRKTDPQDDYLFRNAPVVLFITGERLLDAGMAAQNIEILAVSMGLGVLYNGFLARIADENQELKKWLGIEEKTIRACMLLGYPDRQYRRTVPRKQADIIWK